MDYGNLQSYLIQRPTDDGTDAPIKSPYSDLLNDKLTPLPGKNKRQDGHWERNKKTGAYKYIIDREWYE